MNTQWRASPGTMPRNPPISGSWVVRTGIKNPLTVLLYEHALILLRRAILLRDQWILRLYPGKFSDITPVTLPPGRPKYARLAIFAVFTDCLEANHIRAIDALVHAGYAVVLVNNKPFAAWAEIPESVAFAVENHNFGRDLGAYLRGLSFIESRDVLAEGARVLFLNDSVVYLPGVQAVFKRFSTATDAWVGAGEILHGGHHITSWCFQLSLDLLRSGAFRQWAAAFRPLQNRVYLIHAGEMALSQALFASGLRPLVLFGREYWLSLAADTDRSGSDLARVVPNNVVDVRPDAWLHKTNQIHLFTFPGVISGSFPFLKKDLLYRDVFSEKHLNQLCAEINARFGSEIAAECRQYLFARGNGRASRGFANLQWRLGTR